MAHAIYRNDNQLLMVLLALMLLVYGPLLWISWSLSPVDPLDLTFNSMIRHLMHGQFDVDPWIVGGEGFARDGRVYAYWGIWCAVLRLPLWLINRLDIDVTVWSCLAACCVAGIAKIRALLLLRRRSFQSPVADSAIGLMLAYILFGGSQIGYLRISVYQEVIFWTYAFASIFVYFAVKGLLNCEFSLTTLNYMAACSGLALLTRVSTGIGLLIAITLLLLVILVQSGTSESERSHPPMLRLVHAFGQRRVLMPLGILAVLIAATGIVNYFRWGNPTTFANFHLSLANHPFPLKAQGGGFDLHRIPLAVLYYFLPVWLLHAGHGQLIFAESFERWFNRVELPPSSFLLTDLLPFCFIALLAVSLSKRRAGFSTVTVRYAIAITLGLLTMCLLMLAYGSLAYRYRMEFYPVIDLLAFLGLYSTITGEANLAIFSRYLRWIKATLIVSIVTSFMALSLYDLSLSSGKPHEHFQHALQSIYRIGNVL